MTDSIESILRGLSGQLAGRISRPGDIRYGAATAIWAKPVGPMPRAVVHCRTFRDIQFGIAAARSAGLSLSVRGRGHDQWLEQRGNVRRALPGVNAGYITRDRLLRDHLRQQQQRISELVVDNVDAQRHPSLVQWLRTAKVAKTADQAVPGAHSETLSMAA
jgi:hypothetical protein